MLMSQTNRYKDALCEDIVKKKVRSIHGTLEKK
jgi:hypothetical protein